MDLRAFRLPWRRQFDQMHPRSRSTLAELERADWFSRVGVQDTASAEVLGSWTAAIESCNSTAWENLCLEAVNHFRARLRERAPERLNKWNEAVSRFKPAAEALVLAKTAQIVAAQDLPKTFVDTVKWDILHVLMEAEYADVFPPGFYASQAYWYVSGHFPCGWRGEFPEGRRVVF